jgi:hypothetical protein
MNADFVIAEPIRADFVIAGLTRNPWMPDQVRHDIHFVIAGLARNPCLHGTSRANT